MADPSELLRKLNEYEAGLQGGQPQITPQANPAELLRRLDQFEATLQAGGPTDPRQDGGRFVQGPNGMGFTSPGYSTTDPALVERLQAGETAQDVARSSQDQGTIAQHPWMSRLNEAVRGAPFVGSFADEAVGMVSPQARDAMRASSAAMEREKPGQSAALQIAGGLGLTAPFAMAAAGPVMNTLTQGATSLGGQVARAMGMGGVLGGVEGAVYGAGEGSGAGQRGRNAARQGAIGAAAGTAFGALGTLGDRAIKNLAVRFGKTDVSQIAKRFGVSDETAQMLKRAFQSDDPDMVRRLAAAGDEATLADATPAARTLLDAATARGGEATDIVNSAVRGRNARSAQRLTDAMDTTMGAPRGPMATAREIAEKSRPARKAAYDAAYDTPIDYASEAGRNVEAVLRRVDPSDLDAAIKSANKLIRAEGDTAARQIRATIGDGGEVVFDEMPSVRQLDTLKRALDSVGQSRKDQFGRETLESGVAGRLAGDLRQALVEATGGDSGTYAAALRAGGDKLQLDEGLSFGLEALKNGSKTTVEAVKEKVGDMTPDAREALKTGVRSYLDDLLGRARAIGTSVDIDDTGVEEAKAALRNLSSRNARQKLLAILGPEDYRTLAPALNEALASQSMAVSTATNSKTAMRQQALSDAREILEPGMVGQAMRGQPLDAARRLTQTVLGTTPSDDLMRDEQMWKEIASTLAARRGRRSREAAKFIRQAVSGQALTDEQIKLIGQQVGAVTYSEGTIAASRGLGSAE